MSGVPPVKPATTAPRAPAATPSSSGSLDAPATAPSNAELARTVHAVAAGDHAALASLYDSTQRFVFTLVTRLVRDRATAEEVTLDVYLQVWRRASSYAPERGKVLAWLLTIARSRALDRARAERVRDVESNVEERKDLVAPCECDPKLEPEREERCQLVAKALSALPEAQRRVVELAYFGGLSHTEIAERLSEPLGTVKTRVRLGLIKLRELLRPLEQVS
ncbi:MAG: sigma-70 family RNA polymerase sigma factor [Planctomycetes bacterium]|nr:sigma-70 family RNA polymerase sigma factor [Planctomycetota bacterium]